MAGLYVAGGLIVVAIVALIFFKAKWGRADKEVTRGREEKIEEERVEDARIKKERDKGEGQD